ncbi:zinc ribbon domain-containing protein, partial [Salmonella enterica subsp. enterica serovar Enteritidis]|uniref:zinc ribbon domain-containing protein n=1 Tax=Salmonella enterica TaxID=28901 RepID=UPI0039ED90EC
MFSAPFTSALNASPCSSLTYKAKVKGIEVNEVDERDTSKTCCVCGKTDKNQRVERGLYVCE